MKSTPYHAAAIAGVIAAATFTGCEKKDDAISQADLRFGCGLSRAVPLR